jgi:hypothetical protein
MRVKQEAGSGRRAQSGRGQTSDVRGQWSEKFEFRTSLFFPQNDVLVIAVATATRTVCYLFLVQTTSSLFRLSIRVSTFPLAS